MGTLQSGSPLPVGFIDASTNAGVADRNAHQCCKTRSAVAHRLQQATQEPPRRPRAVEAYRPRAQLAGRPDTTQIGRFGALRAASALGGGERGVHDVQETSLLMAP